MKKMMFLSFISIVFGAQLAQASGQCSKEEQAAQQQCSDEKFTSYKAQLAALNSSMAGKGAATQAADGAAGVSEQKANLDSLIALCEEKRQGCIKTCQSDAQQKRARTPVPDEQGATQDDQKRKKCETEVKEKKDNAQKTSDGMGEAIKGLLGLLQALGASKDDVAVEPTKPFCTEYPNDPACKTDTANDTNSTLTAGEFRKGDEGTFAEGEVGSENAPAGGPAAQTSMSSPMGGMGMAGMGGGGGAPAGGKAEKESGKKSEFDGSPKINLAGGAMGAGGGGGNKGGGSSLGKGSGNPIASRTGLNDENAANKLAAVAEERLRGPASNNEPLGGISSVYYLDNFTKVEKRIINERNTLKEH